MRESAGCARSRRCPSIVLGATPVTVECFHLHCKRAGEFIESPFRTVLLGNVVYFREAAGERHARDVDGRHLGRKHCLELIPRLNTFDDRQHEIEPVLVDVLTASTCVGELAHNAVYKVSLGQREDPLDEHLTD